MVTNRRSISLNSQDKQSNTATELSLRPSVDSICIPAARTNLPFTPTCVLRFLALQFAMVAKLSTVHWRRNGPQARPLTDKKSPFELWAGFKTHPCCQITLPSSSMMSRHKTCIPVPWLYLQILVPGLACGSISKRTLIQLKKSFPRTWWS